MTFTKTGYDNPLPLLLLTLLLILPILSNQSGVSRAEESTKNPGANNLTAHIVLSHSADFVGSWIAENKLKQLPASRVKKIKKDKPFFAAFFAKGLAGNHADRYQFEIDWKLYKPDGSVLFAEDGYAHGSGPVPKDPVFSIAYPTLFIVLDKSDPPGNYRLEATVQDKVTKTRAVDSVAFEFSH